MDPVSLIGGNLMNMLNAAKGQLDALKASIGKAQDLLAVFSKFSKVKFVYFQSIMLCYHFLRL
jgi:hypothetical protein